jgi:hypothetical protein
MGIAALSPLSLTTLWSELLGFALAIAFSPLHIGVLLLLLIGPEPLRRGGWFVTAWLLISALELTLMLSVGHGLLLTMDKGSQHRTGLDLLGAGALLAVGMNELLSRSEAGASPAWSRRLDQFGAMPLLPLLGVSAAIQVLAPDDLFLFAKASGSLLEAGFNGTQEILTGAAFSLATGMLLLLPLLAVLLLGRDRVLPWLRGSMDWLVAHADGLVASLSLVLAAYLGWQGIEGLRLG